MLISELEIEEARTRERIASELQKAATEVAGVRADGERAAAQLVERASLVRQRNEAKLGQVRLGGIGLPAHPAAIGATRGLPSSLLTLPLRACASPLGRHVSWLPRVR